MPKRAAPASLDLGDMPGPERRAIVEQYLSAHNGIAVLADGWDHAIIGLADLELERPRIVYDLNAMVDTLMARDGMAYQDAREFLEVNVLGSFIRDPMPIYVERVDRL